MNKAIIVAALVFLLVMAVGCSTKTESEYSAKKVVGDQVEVVKISPKQPVIVAIDKDSEGHFIPVDGNTYVAD